MCQGFSIVALKDVEICAPPLTFMKIHGDDNSFLRTISYLVTGNQNTQTNERHGSELPRQFIITQTIHNTDYSNESCMNNLGKWATEVEIIPTASLFATEICVFSRFGRNHK